MIVLTTNDLECQGPSTPFSIGFWRVPRYTFGADLVILARKRDELSWSQAAVYGRTDGRTDGQTDGQTEVTTIPLRPKWPRGKKAIYATRKGDIV